MATADAYPRWRYFPAYRRLPQFLSDLIRTFADLRDGLDSRERLGLKSDDALAVLRPALMQAGWDVEQGKKASQRIRRPSLFGELGAETKSFEIDAYWPSHGVALEVEAGRGARGNAVYRDIIEGSLLVDAAYLVLAVALEYHHKSGGKAVMVPSYRDATNLLEAIYASPRLALPFEGLLLIGY